jgi:tyrosinase
MKATLLRVRPSLEELADQYKNGDKKPLETVMRAWKGIKELLPNDPNSFFMLGGYHGEPFRGAGWGNPYYWGGYCNHGNVLFPTWHRVYLVKLEEALQSIPGCKDVMLPFWDETSDESADKGIPWPLTDEFFVLDGKKIPNPLRSFVFPQTIQDNINTDDPSYTKPKEYETVRYPLSGLVGSDSDAKASKAHNKKFPNYKKNVELLNQNVVRWLTSYVVVKKQKIPTNVIQKYKDCLDAPNYTLFSNTTSAQEWNTNPPNGKKVVALENPHNSIHLSVGGFDVPSSLLVPGGADFSPIKGANGDMGENDTAGLDPIFFFHHCHVDRMFWLWQKKNGFTDYLEIMPEYPGTNSVDNQGPTPGVVPNSWLTLETPLNPFKKTEKGKERTYTSLDCINIEKQLGYTYSKGSLEAESVPVKAKAMAMAKRKGESERMIHISGINRAPIRGSFLVTAYANIDGKKQLVGTDAILSRWTVKYCANCQTHLEVKAHFSLRGLPRLQAQDVEVEIQTRDGVITTPGHNTARALLSGGQPGKKLFHLEVR